MSGNALINAFVRCLKKPCVKRALRTFLQTALGYVAVNIATTDLSVKSAGMGLVISAISAGISAAMNLNEKEETNNE